MTKTVSPFRRFIYAFILGVAVNASFAQTVTQQSTVILSKNSKLVQSQAGFYRMTIGDIKVTALSDGTVVLENLGDKLVFCGDIVHVDAVQFDDPAVCIRFDSDPVEAAAQRKSIFADAAKNRYLLAFAHVSFPGVGQVRKEGDHYRWIPLEYMNDALKQESRQSQGEKSTQMLFHIAQ